MPGPEDLGGQKGGADMIRESKRATAAAVAHVRSTPTVYQPMSQRASTINDVLAGLLFGLSIPHLACAERSMVLNAIDGLIRLKIDAGLLKGSVQSKRAF